MSDRYVETLYEHKREEIIEMKTFKSNMKTERKPEVCADNFYDRTGIIKIICVGDYSGGWRKRVYIEDYISPDKTISENPYYSPIIVNDFPSKILHDISGKGIRIQIWNIGEKEKFSQMFKVWCKNSCGVIVFWGARSSSIDNALNWKHHISPLVGQDVPFVLVVDNVSKTPAKWIGEGLVMNSEKDMNSFCLEHGLFAWFEVQERAGGEKSVFGQAMKSLINEIISRKKKL